MNWHFPLNSLLFTLWKDKWIKRFSITQPTVDSWCVKSVRQKGSTQGASKEAMWQLCSLNELWAMYLAWPTSEAVEDSQQQCVYPGYKLSLFSRPTFIPSYIILGRGEQKTTCLSSAYIWEFLGVQCGGFTNTYECAGGVELRKSGVIWEAQPTQVSQDYEHGLIWEGRKDLLAVQKLD